MQPQADFGDELPSEQQLDKFEVYIKEKNDEKVNYFLLSSCYIGYCEYVLQN
jgi:hypothetical protein